METDLVTVVVTSCGRQDLLDRTMGSFFAANTYREVMMLVIEDGRAARNKHLMAKYSHRPVTWLETGKRVGQIRAIDIAYARVKSPFLFHCEDDWEFTSGYFIERSMEVLRSCPHCLQVLIRAPNDLNGHPIESVTEYAGAIPFKRLSPGYLTKGGRFDPDLTWHGFSFNPGLRRLADYRAIGSYSAVAGSRLELSMRVEEAVGVLYHKRGFHCVVLVDNECRGYVRHIGDDRHVSEPLAKRLYFKIRDIANLKLSRRSR